MHGHTARHTLHKVQVKNAFDSVDYVFVQPQLHTKEHQGYLVSFFLHFTTYWGYMFAFWSFENAHELLNLRVPKISTTYKNHTFRYMVKIACEEFRRNLSKFPL